MKTSLLHKDEVSGVPFLGALPARGSNSGIMVLSADIQVRYMSGPAIQLVKSVRQTEAELTIPGIVPTFIEDFCADVLKMAAMASTGGKGVSREMRRLAGEPDRPILLRGFALLNGSGIEKAHVLVVLEETGGQC